MDGSVCNRGGSTDENERDSWIERDEESEDALTYLNDNVRVPVLRFPSRCSNASRRECVGEMLAEVGCDGPALTPFPSLRSNLLSSATSGLKFGDGSERL